MGTMTTRVRGVRQRMDAACDRRPAAWQGRPVQLLAASKDASVEQVKEAIDAGVDLIGENRVQELARKFTDWRPTVPCHFIGRLQRNKVRVAIGWCAVIQSVDSLSLAEAIHDRVLAGSTSRTTIDEIQPQRILVQINLAGERSKGGFLPHELKPALEQMAVWPGLAIDGLMVIPPYAPDPEATRPYFQQLQQLAGEAAGWRIDGVSMSMLSMGMSHDFEVAIEEGATLVRIGTALFGPRTQ